MKCPSNRTVTSNGPLMSVCMCVWGPDQLYDLIKLNNVFYLYECVCVCGLFRYLTQLPPLPPTHTREGIVKIKGGGDIPAGVLTLFSIFSPTLSKDSPVFSPFSLFSLYEG